MCPNGDSSCVAPGLTWKAEATTLMVAIRPLAMAKSYSPFQKAGCLLAGRYCGVGSHFVCGLPPILSAADVIACPVSMRP